MQTRSTSRFLAVAVGTCALALPVLRTHAQSATPAVAPAALPDGKTIVQRSLDAIGSKEARDSVHSTHMKLTAQSLMGTSKISLTLRDPNQVLMTQSIEGVADSQVEIGFDGSIGWMQTAHAPPRTLTTEMCAQFASGADAQELARSLDTRFASFTTLGAEILEGTETWKVRLVDSDGIATVGFFAKGTGLLRALEHTQQTPQGEATSRTLFDRWELVGPILCCRSLTVSQLGAKQEITFDEILFNKVAADAIRAPDVLRAPPATAK